MFVETKRDSEVQTKPELQHPSLDGLIAWLETQDENESYQYGDAGDCLISRYLRAQGFCLAACDAVEYSYLKFKFILVLRRLAPELNRVARGAKAYGYGEIRRYGGALEVARELRGKQ